MRKFFLLSIFFFIVSVTSAQWVLEPFDNAVGNTWPDTASTELNSRYMFANGASAFVHLFNETDSKDGNGSMKLDYKVQASDSWGGYSVITSYLADSISDKPYIDLSAGTELSLWYKIVTPVSMTQNGDIFSEIKLAEYDNNGNRDLWVYKTTIKHSDNSGEWINIKIPLVQSDDKTTGFALQFGEGDGELQFDKIKGFEITFVYITSGNSDNPPSAEGSILIDKLQLLGTRYTPLQTFDTAVADSFFVVDTMSWAGSGAGSSVLSDNTTDFVEGSGSFQWDYTINASQSWGGYVRITPANPTPIDTLQERTALVLYIKNLVPQSGTANRVSFRFTLVENNTGEDEWWTCEVPIKLSEASEWTRYYLPLRERPVYNDSIYGGPGHNHFPSDGFSQPWWESKGDGVFNPESVKEWHVTLSAGDPSYGPQGEKLSGTLLFDVFQQSGFQYSDNTPPDVPSDIAVVAGNYSNLITWKDVPGEEGEKYNVYYSTKPISDINAEGVEVVQLGVEENVQVVEHVLLSPSTDQEVTYYYAVNAVDKVGNVGTPGATQAITNTAKGTTTISMVAPTNFTADGDLSEWAGITPFRIFPSDGSGTVKTGTTIDGDDDCSAEAYVAIQDNYLYVAFNVNDDVVHHEESCDSWSSDSPDLLIGLYNWHGTPHTDYQRGSQPDYHLRFGKYLARSDHWSNPNDSLLISGTENYIWKEKFTGGYTVEAKIPFADLASTKDTIPTIKEGFRIPIDFVINDNDNKNPDGQCWQRREGILTYSPRNQDQGWKDVSVWSYTWYGNKWIVSARDNKQVKNVYSLSQNYPNPFNPTTTIKYSIAKTGKVSINIYNLLGQEVAQLVNKVQPAGNYSVNFDATKLSTGIYFYQIKSGSFKKVKKMLLVK